MYCKRDFINNMYEKDTVYRLERQITALNAQVANLNNEVQALQNSSVSSVKQQLDIQGYTIQNLNSALINAISADALSGSKIDNLKTTFDDFKLQLDLNTYTQLSNKITELSVSLSSQQNTMNNLQSEINTMVIGLPEYGSSTNSSQLIFNSTISTEIASLSTSNSEFKTEIKSDYAKLLSDNNTLYTDFESKTNTQILLHTDQINNLITSINNISTLLFRIEIIPQ